MWCVVTIYIIILMDGLDISDTHDKINISR